MSYCRAGCPASRVSGWEVWRVWWCWTSWGSNMWRNRCLYTPPAGEQIQKFYISSFRNVTNCITGCWDVLCGFVMFVNSSGEESADMIRIMMEGLPFNTLWYWKQGDIFLFFCHHTHHSYVAVDTNESLLLVFTCKLWIKNESTVSWESHNVVILTCINIFL